MIKKIIFSLIILCITILANDKVSLQIQWKHQFQFAGYYIAKEKGFYENIGLDVNIKELSSGISPIDELKQNRTTYAVGRSSLIIDKSNGANIKLLSAIFQSSPSVLMAMKSSNIKTVKDFVGKKLMITQDVIDNVAIQAIVKQSNIMTNDMIQLKHSFNTDDLISGKTDLLASYISNEPFLLKEKGIEYIIFDPKDYGFDFYSDILFTSDNEIKNHTLRATNFTNASIKGWEYAFNNIEETVKLILEKYNTQNKSKEALIFEANELKKLAYYNTKKLGKINKNKIQRIYDIYNVMGLTKSKINFDEFIYNTNPSDTLLLTKNERNYINKKNRVIRMCNNSILSPIEFAYNGNQNDMRGISIDTLNLIEKKLDIKFVNVYTKDWGESQEFLKKKKCDILPVSIVTPKRAKYANFTESYLQVRSAIFTQKNSPHVVSFDDVADKSMAQIKNSGVLDQLLKKYPNLTIIETESTKEALEFVDDGKAYFTTGFAEVGIDILNKYALDNVYIAGYTKKLYDITIAVRDDEILLVNILNKALDNITKEQHRTIYRKWVSSIVKEKVVDYTLLWQVLFVLFLVILLGIYRHYILGKTNKNLEQLQVKLEKKSEVLEDTLLIMSKYIIYSRTNLKGVITEASDAFCDISQYSRDELMNKPHNIIRHPDMPKEAFKNMWEVIQSGKTWKGEVKNKKKDGSFYWVEADISPEFDKDGNIFSYVAIRHDITDKKKVEEIAITDGLTSLYNRRHFDTLFPEQIALSKREQKLLAFVLIDIDHFKQYNDIYGHQDGDTALKLVASALKKSLKRPNDYTFRLGGEEFGLIYFTKSKDQALLVASQVRESVENLKIKHTGNSASKFITISSGLYIINNDDNVTVDVIYKKTDEALYISKHNGRNQVSTV